MSSCDTLTENGRAYPDYLIRYYRRPSRDAERTPFECIEEALEPGGGRKGSSVFNLINSNRDIASNLFVWEYRDGSKWTLYSSKHQAELEARYQELQSVTGRRVSLTSIVHITTEDWTYHVDVTNLIQTNVGHTNKKQRPVRRRQVTPV